MKKVFIPAEVHGGEDAAFIHLPKVKNKPSQPHLCHGCGKRSSVPFVGKLCDRCVVTRSR